MPGRTFHALCGAAVVGTIAHLVLPEDLPDRGYWILGLAGLGAVGGLAPDLLEPALHPNHRAFFHSVVAAVGVGYLVKQTYDRVREPGGHNDGLALLTMAVAVGYCTHLGADMWTPSSLPLLGLKG